MRTKVIRIMVVVLIIGAVGTYLYLEMSSSGPDMYYGEVQYETYDVYSKTAGIIETVLVEEGQHIDAGGSVMVLENTAAALALEKADLAKKAADLQLEKAESPVNEESLRIQELTIEGLMAEKDRLTASLSAMDIKYSSAVTGVQALKEARDYNQSLYDDQMSLFEEGLVTQAVLDTQALQLSQSQSAYAQGLLAGDGVLAEKKALAFQLEGLEQQILAAQTQLNRLGRGADPLDRALTEVNGQAALTDVHMAEERLTAYEVKAYQQGVIESIYYSSGEFVNAGAPVLTLKNPNRMETTLYIPEKDLLNVQTGQQIRFQVVAAPERTVTGEVIHIAGEAMFTPVNIVTSEDRERLVFEVTVALTPSEDLRSGMLLATEPIGRE